MSPNVWTAASDGDLESVKAFAAVSYSHIELVVFLLASGADIHLGDNDRDTPLHLCETVECAQVLLEAGADLNARNSDGRTPYDVAIEDENDMLMAMYENLGAEKSGATITEEEHGFLNGES
uniref:Uncharacterized protein n=1 Tax=Hyaloperonospora arabidopsidis (strain Emoy2) TaxID=559515 RepID=M4BA95_HYAAE